MLGRPQPRKKDRGNKKSALKTTASPRKADQKGAKKAQPKGPAKKPLERTMGFEIRRSVSTSSLGYSRYKTLRGRVRAAVRPVEVQSDTT